MVYIYIIITLRGDNISEVQIVLNTITSLQIVMNKIDDNSKRKDISKVIELLRIYVRYIYMNGFIDMSTFFKPFEFDFITEIIEEVENNDY